MADLVLTLQIQAIDQASSIISGMGGALGGLASGALNIATSAMINAGKAVADFGMQSVQTAGDYQQSMLKVQSLAGYSAMQINQANAAIMQMSGQVAQSPKQLADGLYYVASAGFAGSQALSILRLSAEAAATGGTDTLTVANGLTSALNAFGMSGDKAGMVMDEITKTVSAGKMQMSDYASVIGKLSTVSKAAGISFDQANAALATMTNSGYSAQYGSTLLSNLFTSLDIKTDALAKHAHALGITFDEQKFKSMDLAGQIRYLDTVTQGSTDTMYKLLGSNATALKTYEALKTNLASYGKTLDAVRASQGATADSFAITTQGFNFQMQRLSASLDVLKITVGSALLPVLNSLLSMILPVIQSFAQWIQQSNVVQNVITYIGHAVAGILPDLRTLGTEIMGAVQSVVAWVVQNHVLEQVLHVVMQGAQLLWAVLKAAMPVLGDLFLRLLAITEQFLTWANRSNLLNNIITVVKSLLSVFFTVVQTLLPPVLSAITGFTNWAMQSGILQGALNLVQQGVQLMNSGLLSSLPNLRSWTDQTNQAATAAKGLGGAHAIPGLPGVGGPGAGTGGDISASASGGGSAQSLSPLQQILQQIGDTLHNTILPAWNQFLAVISPIMPQIRGMWVLWQAFNLAVGDMAKRVGSDFIQAWVKVGGDLGQMLLGWTELFLGFGAWLWSWITGNTKGMTDGWNAMKTGVINILVGMGRAIVDQFDFWRVAVVDIVTNFVHDVQRHIMDLSNQLVGHSIIPDMINKIVQWFTDLGPRALSAITNFISQAIGKFTNFASQAYQFGQNVVQNLINGLNSMLGNLGGAAANVASVIAAYLPHSPAQRGPLQHVDQFMPSFISMMSGQLQAGAPQLAASMTTLVTPLATTAPAGRAGGSAGGGHTFNITVNAPGRSRTEANDIANQVLDVLSRKFLGSGLLLPTTKGL